MHVTDTGSGLPLVLLHAFPFDSRMWDRVRPSLATHTRVITPDQRGFGATPLAGEPDLALIAADVLAMLDGMGIDRVVLGGCSMGGYVAMAMLATAPERISGLLLVDTKATADTPQARQNRLAMAERAEREGVRGWLADAMLPTLLGSTTSANRPDVLSTARWLLDQTSPAAVAWAQRAMAARPDSTALLRDITAPALVVYGEQDALIPVESARAMAGLLPNAELVVLPDAGHLPPLEVPAALVDAVTAWLARMP